MRYLKYILLACFCIFFSFEIRATSLEISPVQLEISSGETITSMELKNQSEDTAVFQISIMKWKSIYGKEILEETSDVIATPPIIELSPNETKIIRIGLANPEKLEKWPTYRVILKEIPTSSSEKLFIGLKTLLNIRIPLLIDSIEPMTPKGNWVVSRVSQNQMKLKLINTGKYHYKIEKLSLKDESQKLFVEKIIFDYLIPTQEKEWILDVPGEISVGRIHVSATTNQGEISAIVPVESY